MNPFLGSTARAAVLALVLAGTASGSFAAASFGGDLRLAAGVVRAATYTPPKATNYVTSIETPVFTTTSFNQPAAALRLRQGDPVVALAETDEGHWVLVGRNGVGVGYVARSTICPTSLCRPGSGTASPPR
jgi:hypothetical protein